MIILNYTKLLVFSFAFMFFAYAQAASAASLYFSPSSGEYVAGKTLLVSVYISSVDQAMNGASGVISFPRDKLEVVSLSKTGSIFSLWIQEPSFSNREGTVNFEGIVLNPGFQRNVGKILAITFRVKNTGKATIFFQSGSVLANDGKGTNILSSLGTAVFNLTEVPAPPRGEESSGLSTVIDSTPPVAGSGWYNFDSIEFHWNVPKGATAMIYDISDNPDYKLSETARDVVSKTTYDLTGFSDGVWRFFVRFKKGNAWGSLAMQSFQLDRTPPEPFAIVRQDSDLTNPRPTFSWQATDKPSGVAYYQVKIGEGDYFNPESIKLETTTTISYVLPTQSPAASRTLIVRAYDQAGNFREATTNFAVFSPNNWYIYWHKFTEFFSQWGWLLRIIIVVSVVALYFLIYRLIRWRRDLKAELRDFKNELRRDLKRLEVQIEFESDKGQGLKVDLRPSRLQKARESLQKEAEHIEEDIKKEVKKLDEFTGE